MCLRSLKTYIWYLWKAYLFAKCNVKYTSWECSFTPCTWWRKGTHSPERKCLSLGEHMKLHDAFNNFMRRWGACDLHDLRRRRFLQFAFVWNCEQYENIWSGVWFASQLLEPDINIRNKNHFSLPPICSGTCCKLSVLSIHRCRSSYCWQSFVLCSMMMQTLQWRYISRLMYHLKYWNYGHKPLTYERTVRLYSSCMHTQKLHVIYDDDVEDYESSYHKMLFCC